MLVASFVLPLTSAGAQPTAMQPGAKVRLRVADVSSKRITGVVLASTGAAIGGLIGLAILPNPGCAPRPCKTDLNSEAAFVALAGGVMYGAGIGALVKSERWETLSLARRDDLR